MCFPTLRQARELLDQGQYRRIPVSREILSDFTSPIQEQAVRELGGEIPILGVCLGHQAICEAYGATVGYAKRLMHGKQSRVSLISRYPLFAGCGPMELVGRYHSLAPLEETLPECLTVTAKADDGEIMAVRHKDYSVFGLQFHPESILTPAGNTMLRNFINLS